REVVGDEGVGEAAEGDGDEDELRLRGRARELHPAQPIALRADEGQDALHQRDAHCNDGGEMAELRNHRAAPRCAFPKNSSKQSDRMVVQVGCRLVGGAPSPSRMSQCVSSRMRRRTRSFTARSLTSMGLKSSVRTMASEAAGSTR